MSDSLQPHGLQYSRLLCPPPSRRVCSNSCPLIQWCYITISSSAASSSFCLQSFPASGHPSWITALLRQKGFPNSMKLWAMQWRDTQYVRVTVKGPDNTWCTEGRNANRIQYSCLKNPVKCMWPDCLLDHELLKSEFTCHALWSWWPPWALSRRSEKRLTDHMIWLDHLYLAPIHVNTAINTNRSNDTSTFLQTSVGEVPDTYTGNGDKPFYPMSNSKKVPFSRKIRSMLWKDKMVARASTS